MKIENHKASETLTSELEKDHYNHARSYFRQFGTAEEYVKEAKAAFSNYDTIKDQIRAKMETRGIASDDYLDAIDKMNTERAVYLIELAAKDHKEQSHEPTKSNQWRRA